MAQGDSERGPQVPPEPPLTSPADPPEHASSAPEVGLKDTQFELAPEPDDLLDPSPFEPRDLPPARPSGTTGADDQAPSTTGADASPSSAPGLPSAAPQGPLSVVPIPTLEPLELDKGESPTPPELNPLLWEAAPSEEIIVAPEDDEDGHKADNDASAPSLPASKPLVKASPDTLEPEVISNTPSGAPDTATTSSSTTGSGPAPSSTGDALEEVYFAPTTGEQTHQSGETLTWGGHTFTLEEALPRGWYTARLGEEKVLLRPSADDPFPTLPAHRLTPRVLYSGPEGYAVSYLEGERLRGVMPFEKALSCLLPLAQYAFALEKQGHALLDLDPAGVLDTPEGPRLRFPPRLARVGERVSTLEREGYTAPELLAGTPASGKEGVYLLGALLLEWLCGTPGAPLEGVRVPGVPQLLYRSLGPAQARLTPLELLSALRALLPAPAPVLELGHATSVGLNPERPVNEDSYGYRAQTVGAAVAGSDRLTAVVCDGMGGMAAGEVASSAAVRAFLDGAQTLEPATLEKATWSANRAVLDAMGGQEGGCTLTGASFEGAAFTLAHVGDSRAYRLHASGLEQLSQDHSLVAAMVASKLITPEEAQVHPDKNKILRSLGSVRQEQPGYVQTRAGALEPGEALLLVSDGVWGEVDDAALEALWQQHARAPQALADALVFAALEAGAPDNATAVVVLRSR